MRKVLIVAYHYPPSPQVGAVRPAKFARYLPEFGWTPVVLTISPSESDGHEARCSGERIHRVSEWWHPLKWYVRVKERRYRSRGLWDELAAKHVPYEAAMAANGHGSARIKQWVLAFLRLPDSETGWLAPAIWHGVRVIREECIGQVITTGPPFTCQLIGLVLKGLTGVQWVADFQDPWSLSDKLTIYRNRATDFVESRLIRSVMREADIVVANTSRWEHEVRIAYPELDPSKFVTITNGFDPAEFLGLDAECPTREPVVFLHPGTFYIGRSPEPFLRALRSLLDEGTVRCADLRVEFVGQVEIAEGLSVRGIVRRLGLENIVSVNAPVPRREALQKILKSHVVLVPTEHIPERIPTKTYDALAAGATILNIGCEGETSELVARTGQGVFADYTSLESVRNGILECLRRARSMRSVDEQRCREPWRVPAIQGYSFQQLTGRLAHLLDALT